MRYFLFLNSLLTIFNAVQAWIHPGILHKTVDLDRMKSKVTSKTDPWYSTYVHFAADALSSSTYTAHTPVATLVNRGDFERDGAAAYQNALMWYITGNAAYATKAKAIMNSWSTTLKSLSGVVWTDQQLAASLGPFAMTNAAEIIRYSNAGWAAGDITNFSNMLKNVFYPVLKNHTRPQYEANVGTGNTKALLSFGVFTETQTIYDEGRTNYKSEGCSGLETQINAAGQDSESGRDQQHTMLGLGNMGESCQIVWIQGTDDFWALSGNRLLAGFEYAAKYNLGNSVPYDAAFQRCDAAALGGPWAVISASGRGAFRPVFELTYRHFVGEKAIAAPYTLQVVQKEGLEEGQSNVADSGGWGTLKYRLG